jgi:hypothetical protein
VFATPIVSVAVWPLPPVTVKVHCPAPTGVTVKGPFTLLAGDTVAIPLHELGWPAAAVVTVKAPP